MNIKILFKNIADGDKNALKQFLTEYGGRIKAVAFKVLKDNALSEDVLNFVVLKIWENADKIKSLKNILGYILTIAYNKAIDIKRKQKDVFFEDNILTEKPAKSPDIDEKIFIDSILQNINEPTRSILILKSVYGFSFFDIAKLKKITYKKARNLYKKGCNLFKQMYNKK